MQTDKTTNKVAEKVSIIVPICRDGLNLRRTLETICSQSHKNLEIICVDATLSREIKMILSSYSQKDSRIQCKHVECCNIYAARNEAIALTSGKWIVGVDAGDCLGPKAIEKALEHAGEGIDIVSFGMRRFSEERQVDKGWKHEQRQGLEYIDSYTIIRTRCMFQGKMWRRDLIAKNGVTFPPHLKHSYVSFIYHALLHAKKLVYVKDVLYAYSTSKEREAEEPIIEKAEMGDLQQLFDFCMPSKPCEWQISLLSLIIQKNIIHADRNAQYELWKMIKNEIERYSLHSYLPQYPSVALFYHQPSYVWQELSVNIHRDTNNDTRLHMLLLSNCDYMFWEYHRTKLMSFLTLGRKRVKYKEKSRLYRDMLKEGNKLKTNYKF